jgi:hypothetical protein
MKILTPEEMAKLTAHELAALAEQGMVLTDEQSEIVRRAREQPNDPEARVSKPPHEQGEIMRGDTAEIARLDAESRQRMADFDARFPEQDNA